jgi:hypothetical protein
MVCRARPVAVLASLAYRALSRVRAKEQQAALLHSVITVAVRAPVPLMLLVSTMTACPAGLVISALL